MRCDSRGIGLLIAPLVCFAFGQSLVPISVPAAESAAAPDFREPLLEARKIATQVHDLRGFFLRDTSIGITRLLIQGGDFDAALADLAPHKSFEVDRLLTQIAESLARSGRRKQAEDIMKRVEPHVCCDEDRLAGRTFLDDEIRSAFLDSQIASGDFAGAQKTAEEVTTPWLRHVVRQKLGVGYAKAGDRARSQQAFRDAVSATTPIKSKKNPDGACLDGRPLWEIADAQFDVQDRQGAAETLQRLIQAAPTIKDGLDRAWALSSAAEREARLGDDAAAKRLFRQAIATCDEIKPPTPCPEENRIGHLQRIAKAEAEAGYYDDALKTARSIPKDKSEAIGAIAEIAMARAKNGEVPAAIATALALEPDSWGRTKALDAIVQLQIQKHDLHGAVLTTEKFGDPLERAIASLKIAAAFAESGDRKSAEITVGRIRLASNPSRSGRRIRVFDFEQPGTWGTIYNETGFFSLHTYARQLEDAARLAAAAMSLSQRLNKHYSTSYAALFADFDPTAVRQLARAHAATGHPAEALAWARQIGATKPDHTKPDWQQERPIEQRLAALLGTAEGILGRQGRLRTEE